MTFDEKVKFLRSLPKFRVIPISDVRAIAFVATEKAEKSTDDIVIAHTPTTLITLTPDDLSKILREYPDLEACLN